MTEGSCALRTFAPVGTDFVLLLLATQKASISASIFGPLTIGDVCGVQLSCKDRTITPVMTGDGNTRRAMRKADRRAQLPASGPVSRSTPRWRSRRLCGYRYADPPRIQAPICPCEFAVQSVASCSISASMWCSRQKSAMLSTTASDALTLPFVLPPVCSRRRRNSKGELFRAPCKGARAERPRCTILPQCYVS